MSYRQSFDNLGNPVYRKQRVSKPFLIRAVIILAVLAAVTAKVLTQ